MKSVEFCYWLQGLFELGKPKALDAEQTDLVRRHLSMVFKHEIDPSYPAQQQQDLSNLHVGTPPKYPYADTGIAGTAHDPNVLFRC